MSAHAASVGRRLRREPHDDPFDAPREERDRRVLLRVDPVGDHLGEPGLGLAPRLERPAHDDGRLARSREQVGEHVLLHHQLHLVRDARHRVDDLVPDLGADAGRGADRVRDHVRRRGTSAWRRLFCGHVAAPRAEERGDVLDQLLAALELDAHDLGDRVAGHVVLRGPDAAAHDDRVR